MTWLLSLYIGATVFGVGVTLIDFLGLLGDQEDDADDGGAEALDSDGGAIEADFDVDAGDADFDGDADADFDGGAGEPAEADDAGDVEEAGSDAGHDIRRRRSIILRIMTGLRSLVYFALGFGPVGWFALSTGQSTMMSLAYAAPVGGVVLLGARLLRRVLRSELTSEIKESDLLMEKGTVTVTVNPGQLGRVRVTVGGAYADRYARGKDTEEPLRPGELVRVVEVSDECVYVERESS
jgi:membrane protein implicated in regulation of membrane protease activity